MNEAAPKQFKIWRGTVAKWSNAPLCREITGIPKYLRFAPQPWQSLKKAAWGQNSTAVGFALLIQLSRVLILALAHPISWLLNYRAKCSENSAKSVGGTQTPKGHRYDGSSVESAKLTFPYVSYWHYLYTNLWAHRRGDNFYPKRTSQMFTAVFDLRWLVLVEKYKAAKLLHLESPGPLGSQSDKCKQLSACKT